MSTGIWSAASGAVSQMTALDIAANNVANATTPGYRADRALFRQELNRAKDGSAGSRSMRYAITRTVEPDRKQGQLVFTGRTTDVALRDRDSLFVVKTPQGERYTRAGSIQVAADGTLRTPDGYLYVGADHKVLRARSDARGVSVGNNGNIIVDNVETGQQLFVVKFANPSGMVKEGDVLLRATPNAGRLAAVAPDLEVATLESSNASALGSMTSLVQASREFEMLTKVIDAFSQVELRVAQSVAQK
jgi:flagellar basal-body rod protein FlgF